MFFLKKKIIKIKNKVSVIFFHLTLVFPQPLFVALGLYLLLQPLSERRKYRVLAINKDVSEGDVKALNQFGSEIQYLCLSVGTLKWILRAVTGESFRELTAKNYDDDSLDDIKNKYYQFLKKLIPIFNKMSGIDGVLACNFIYTSQREFAKVYFEMDFPYVVLFKEGGMIPGRTKDWQKHWEKNNEAKCLYAHKLLTYNKMTESVFASSNMEGVNKSTLIATGCPRLDAYKNDSVDNSIDQKKLVLFAFDPVFACFYFDEISSEFDSTQLENDLYDKADHSYKLIYEFAKKHQDVEVFIKIKSSLKNVFIAEILDKYFLNKKGKPVLQNITLVRGQLDPGLIRTSTAVIGFNSTTVVEAILSNKPVLTPDFEEIFKDKSWNYFDEFPELYNKFDTIEDIEEVIFSNTEINKTYPKICDRFVKTYAVTGKEKFSTYIIEDQIKQVVQNKAVQ